MKKICEFITEHAMKIINFIFLKNEVINKREPESYENSKICFICKGKFGNKYLKDKQYCKVRDHCHYTGEYRGTAHSICNFKYSVPKKFPWFFIIDQTMMIILS